ncbi:uncharacterized protein [Acropora muricata]|uniref:uncharacterized protein n=1 Tax=Acropora muricata TaxID=159855 RepID=UPI0034E4840F
MIFQVYVAAAALKVKEHQTILVVCPLGSIIDDQIKEAKGMGMSAASLPDVTDDELRSGTFQLLFASAEKVIDNRFLDILKDGTALHRNVAAVVVDECHTVETWTGKRSAGKRNAAATAFRDAFGKLWILRSFCKQGSAILALTGTADRQTRNIIIKELQMKEVRKVHVSPNRPNLCISVVKCKREDMFNHLEWLVDVIMKKGTKTPKTIIFCNGTLTDIGAVFNYLLLRLGGAAYSPDDSQASDQCLIVKGPVFGSEPVVHLSQPTLTRPVSPGDKHDLREALSEVVHGLIQTMNLLSDNIDPEYAEQIVDVLVENAHVIFTVMVVTDHIPLFALQHALKILEVFHEMFEDIPNIELMVELFGRETPIHSYFLSL